MKKFVILGFMALLLCACGSRVETEVTAFHKFQGAPTGKTFVMVPYKDQEGSLEWQSYANLVGRELEKHEPLQIRRPLPPIVVNTMMGTLTPMANTAVSTPVVRSILD